MAIQVTCKCGKRLRVKHELAGKRVKCPSCQSPFVVPSGGVGVAHEPAAAVLEPGKAERRGSPAAVDPTAEPSHHDGADRRVEPPVELTGSSTDLPHGSMTFLQRRKWLVVAIGGGALVAAIVVVCLLLFLPAAELSLGKIGPGLTRIRTLKSPDGKRVASVIHRGKGDAQVVPGKGGPSALILAAGKEYVVLDGASGPEFDSIREMVFSPDSRRLMYTGYLHEGKGLRDQRAVCVVDGKTSKEYESARDPVFSPDSKRTAFRTSHGLGMAITYSVVVDGAALSEKSASARRLRKRALSSP